MSPGAVVAAAYGAAKQDIAANGPAVLRDLVAATDALLERNAAAWTPCQKTARKQTVVDCWKEARKPTRLASPAEQRIIQIDITNACPRSCSNCTRLCGHGGEPWFMAAADFRRAVDSLADYPGMVGVMGGEPTLHPQFAELVAYLEERRPDPPAPRQFSQYAAWTTGTLEAQAWKPYRKGLWTSLGPGYRRHFEQIQRAFRYQCINDHRGGMHHGAILLARKELGIPDCEWERLRNACWLQHAWSATVTPGGAYFCEVAATLAGRFGGPEGWAVDPGWWRRKQEDFGSQLDLCERCSACLPAPTRVDRDSTDQATPEAARELRALGSGKAIEVVTATWEELKATHRLPTGPHPYAETGDRTRIHSPSGQEVGPLTAVVVCRDYDDYLALTLPRTCEEFARVIVITAVKDKKTQDLIRRHHCESYSTNVLDDAHFPKGLAISMALRTLPADAWVVSLDADILVPRGWGKSIGALILNPGALHYVERFGPPLGEWRSAAEAARIARETDNWTRIRETYGDRLYTQKAPWGYCQIFNLSAQAAQGRPTRYPSESQTAEADDLALAFHWYGKERCVEIAGDGFAVLHLPHGPSRTNWAGRTSPRLDNDVWWINDDGLRWRVSYRAGHMLAGLWELATTVSIPAGAAIVEIGTMLGDGAAVWAQAHPDRRVITVDPGPTPECREEATRRCRFWPNIEQWHMTSEDAARRCASEGITVGLVYIDGDHEEAGVRADIHAWLPLLGDGGLMAGHDYGVGLYPGVKAAVDGELGRPARTFVDSSWLMSPKQYRGQESHKA